MMNMNKIINVYMNVVNALFFVFIFFLLILSIYSTSHVSLDIIEKVYYVKDNSKLNIFIIIVSIIVFYLISSSKFYKKISDDLQNNNHIFKIIKIICLSVLFLISCIWIIMTRPIPEYDQLYIMQGAEQLSLNDYRMFIDIGYFAKFHHQIGIMYYAYFLTKLFGSHNLLVFQFTIALATVLFYKVLVDLMDLFEYKKIHQVELLILSIIFFPLWMYVTFPYGNTLGLCSAILAIKYLIKYTQSNKLKDIVLVSVFIFFAMCFKQNYQIFLIAIIIHLLLFIIKNKDYKKTMVISFLLVAYLLSSNLPVMMARRMTHEKLDQGISPLAYIAMGLQESRRAPGWYNEYVDQNYIDANYSTEKSAIDSKNEIVKRINYFISEPLDAIRFFSFKIASAWNNPTFQGLWINQIKESYIEHNKFIDKLYSPGGTLKIAKFLDVQHLLVLFGTLLYTFFNKQKDLKYFLIPIIILGGAMFHIIWEAKSQYILYYFVLLLPLCIKGYSLLFDNFNEFINNRSTYLKENRLKIVTHLFLCLLCIFIFNYLVKYVELNTCENFFVEQSKEFTEYLSYLNPK